MAGADGFARVGCCGIRHSPGLMVFIKQLPGVGMHMRCGIPKQFGIDVMISRYPHCPDDAGANGATPVETSVICGHIVSAPAPGGQRCHRTQPVAPGFGFAGDGHVGDLPG